MTISVTKTTEIENLIANSLVQFDETGSMWVCQKTSDIIMNYFKQVERLHDKVEILLAEKDFELDEMRKTVRNTEISNKGLLNEIKKQTGLIYERESRAVGAKAHLSRIMSNVDTITTDMTRRQSDHVEDLYDELLNISCKAEDALNLLNGETSRYEVVKNKTDSDDIDDLDDLYEELDCDPFASVSF